MPRAPPPPHTPHLLADAAWMACSAPLRCPLPARPDIPPPPSAPLPSEADPFTRDSSEAGWSCSSCASVSSLVKWRL